MSIDLRELEKAIMQYVVLPLAYRWFCRGKISPRKVLFADSKNDGISYNLMSMYQEVKKRGYDCVEFCYNFEEMSAWKKLCTSISFMKQYATARYVFIADYYLPVSSCHKRKETTVVQLWHASGLQKKFGYDTGDDLKNLKLINPVRNFDLVSVSAENLKQAMMKNWRLPAEKIQVLGSSRTDILFDQSYLSRCKEKFYGLYPKAKGKKVILWAPTFRGKGYKAEVRGLKEIGFVKEQLVKNYFFVTKLHPNTQRTDTPDTCSLNTEEVYAVTDVLITDYSSVFYDYLLVKRNVIFFVPDYKEYQENRGLYIDYQKEFKYPIATDGEELLKAIKGYADINEKEVRKYREKFITMNDGNVSKRILNYLEDNHEISR